MKFILRRPDAAYLDTHLWLPKKYWSEAHIKRSLQYDLARTGEILDAYVETSNHYIVPRNFLSWRSFALMKYPVFDVRHTDFPTVDFKSNVILDKREEGKTYQRESYEALRGTYDGILTLKCGAGKTVVALHTAASFRVPILIIVSDKGLAEQWLKEIKQCLGIDESEVGRIGGDGAPFDWEGTRITIAIVNTLAKRVQDDTLPPELTRYFGIVICDEAHVMAAPYFNLAVPPFHGRRWGLTATPDREDGFTSLLHYTFGHVVFQYLMPDLMPIVYFRKLNTVLDTTDRTIVDLTHDSTGELHFGMLYNYFATIDARVEKIVADVQAAIKKDGRQVLVLTHSRDLCERLGTYFPDGGVVHAGVKGKERFNRVANKNPVIAIMQLGKQALDKPILDTIYICEPFKKKGMLQQVMGRALRPHPKKQRPVIVFYEDAEISAMYKLCQKVRATLSRWPANKGGRIRFFNK